MARRKALMINQREAGLPKLGCVSMPHHPAGVSYHARSEARRHGVRQSLNRLVARVRMTRAPILGATRAPRQCHGARCGPTAGRVTRCPGRIQTLDPATWRLSAPVWIAGPGGGQLTTLHPIARRKLRSLASRAYGEERSSSFRTPSRLPTGPTSPPRPVQPQTVCLTGKLTTRSSATGRADEQFGQRVDLPLVLGLEFGIRIAGRLMPSVWLRDV